MDLFGFDPPNLADDEVARIAADRYGVVGSQQRLRGERSHNTLFTLAEGRRVVLKVAAATESTGTIDFHAMALCHLERVAPELPVARMVPDLDGSLVPRLERRGAVHGMRMVTFLPGVPFADGQPVSEGGLRGVGALVGSLSAALASFDHRAADGFMPWDIGNGLVLDDELWVGLADDARALLEPHRGRLASVLEAMDHLPRQVIHNDAHAGNLLRASACSDTVTGVIDFGDLVRTARVNDLGVTGANLAPHQPDPIAAVVALVTGYRASRPLDPVELDAVPEVVLARLALSTLLTDHQIRTAPHIAADVASERPQLLANLGRWSALDPDAVRAAIHEVMP